MTVVAVTGSSGFIGRHVVRVFRDAGLHVVALRRDVACVDSRLERLIDYSDPRSLYAAVTGADCLVHLAGLAHVSIPDAAEAERCMQAANTDATRRLAEACAQAGVPRFVLLSTAGVLGEESPASGFVDHAKPRPYDAYTRSKLDGETAVATLASSGAFRWLALRPPMVYGPRAPGSFTRLCQAIDAGWPLPLRSVGTLRSLVGIRNLCDALLTVATSNSSASGPMLIADRDPVSVADFLRALARARGRRSRLVATPEAMLRAMLRLAGRRSDYRRLFTAFELRPSRLRDEFGWEPRHSLAEELDWTMREERA